MKKLRCVSHVVFRFYRSDGHAHQQWFAELGEPYVDPEFPDDIDVEIVAVEDDFLDELFAWFTEKDWNYSVNADAVNEYVEAEVDPHANLAEVEAEILGFLLAGPNVERAKESYKRRVLANQEKNKFNPGYGVVLSGINEMMGCAGC